MWSRICIVWSVLHELDLVQTVAALIWKLQHGCGVAAVHQQGGNRWRWCWRIPESAEPGHGASLRSVGHQESSGECFAFQPSMKALSGASFGSEQFRHQHGEWSR